VQNRTTQVNRRLVNFTRKIEEFTRYFAKFSSTKAGATELNYTSLRLIFLR